MAFFSDSAPESGHRSLRLRHSSAAPMVFTAHSAASVLASGRGSPIGEEEGGAPPGTQRKDRKEKDGRKEGKKEGKGGIKIKRQASRKEEKKEERKEKEGRKEGRKGGGILCCRDPPKELGPLTLPLVAV